MPCRGVRGATTAEDNSPEEILKATRQLLALMIRQNGIEPETFAARSFRRRPTWTRSFRRWPRGSWAGSTWR